MLKMVKPIVLFWLFSKFSNLNAPIMQTADQTKIENLSLDQGTVLQAVLALILCGVVALK